MPHRLIKITDIIRDLEKRRWSCDWDILPRIEHQIERYKAQLASGIEYEPNF